MQTFGVTPDVGNGIGISVQSMGVMSQQRAYRAVIDVTTNGSAVSNTQSVTFPLMMAIIKVEKGIVTVNINILYGVDF